MKLIDTDSNIETLCYRFAQKILEEALTVEPASPWHRVEEPPEEYGCYVVYRPYFPWTKAKYIWENGKNRWYSLNGEILCPTHWMPIEPPEEE